MSHSRTYSGRTLLLVLALLLALAPAAALAVWTPLSDFFGTTSSGTQTSLGGEYLLEAGPGISKLPMGGGVYALEGAVDAMIPGDSDDVPQQGQTLYLPLISR